MCIACVLERNAKITEKEFENCWESNKDGGGYVYVGEGNKLTSFKSLEYEDFKTHFEQDYKDHSQYSIFLLHFRAKSEGAVTVDNCHPFFPHKNVALIHNGTIYKMPHNAEKSDTRQFSDDFLRNLPNNFIYNKTMIALIDDYVGTNKIALMNDREAVVIFNKDKWLKSDGRLFSNDMYKVRFTRPATKTCGSTDNYDLDWVNRVYGWHGTYASNMFPVKQQNNSPLMHQCDLCKIYVALSYYDLTNKICYLCRNKIAPVSKQTGITMYDTVKLYKELFKTHFPKKESALALIAGGAGT